MGNSHKATNPNYFIGSTRGKAYSKEGQPVCSFTVY